MASPFEIATRVAIAEIIQTHTEASKFGYILTHDAYAALVDDLYELLVTSRSLKTAGDRLLQGNLPAAKETKPQPPKGRWR